MDGEIHIEFGRRSEAELAKSRGSYYHNDVLSINWKEESTSSTAHHSTDAKDEESEQ